MFQNRRDAAEKLAATLRRYAGNPGAILLAIPRGALEIGAILREQLKLPLDIVVTKKIGAPGNEEFAVGAVDPEGEVTENPQAYGLPQGYLKEEAERLKHVIKRRYREYRGDRPLPELKNKIVILVDDGIATGLTTQAALRYITRQKPQKIVVAVPVCAADTAERMKKEVDEWICLEEPEDFYAVGQFYQNFPQVSDEEAKKLLNLAPL